MDVTLTFRRKDLNRFFLSLVGFSLLLIAAFFFDRLIGSPIWFFERLVNIDGENSFPAWFSSIQLFLIGGFLLLKGWRCDPARGPARWFYLLGAAGFMFLSADEALAIHESVTEALLKYEWLFRFEGDHGMWIPIYLAGMALLMALSWRQVLRLWNYERRAFLLMALGAAIFLFGAVGLEIVAYQFLQSASSLYFVEVAAEEFLEMLGASIILYGSMNLLLEPAPAIQPQVRPAHEEETTARAA
jgi:hypothetical protein